MSHDLLINERLSSVLCPDCNERCVLAITPRSDSLGRSWIRLICPKCSDIKATLGGINLEIDKDDSIDYKHLLFSLLATIHHDGGHYSQEYGTEKAVEEAIRLVIRKRGVKG